MGPVSWGGRRVKQGAALREGSIIIWYIGAHVEHGAVLTHALERRLSQAAVLRKGAGIK